MVRRKTTQKCVAALAVMVLSGSLQAQEMFNVNVWNIGRPASRGGIWGDGVDDAAELATLMLDGATPAGAPGWNTVEWENVELDPNPFAKLTLATTINGTSGSTATFEMFNRRNAASYNWNAVRDDSDVEDVGNATLLDGHVNSTEFDGANGGGNPFGFQISDFEIRDIPFALYDAVIYLGINQGQTFLGNGTIRINNDVDRPSDPTDWGNSVIDEGPLDMSGGTEFTLPTSFQDFEPDGILDEIENSGDTGNYIVFTGLTSPTLTVQTWGEGFTHLGITGFQIREVGGIALRAGDADMDLDFDQLDLVQVQVAAKYLTGLSATWGEGDWDGAPGGTPGDPPPGDGLFNQLDIIAALTSDVYLTGPYAAVAGGGVDGDGQTSIVYDPQTGELGVDAPAGINLTSINIDSAAGIFTGDPAENLGGSFDNDGDDNIFKATFGDSFGSLSFGNVAQAGLSEEYMLDDLTVVGSLAGGGDLGDVDLVYVPEPTSTLLLAIGIGLVCFRRVGHRRAWN